MEHMGPIVYEGVTWALDKHKVKFLIVVIVFGLCGSFGIKL
jgi:hypothetical protein